MTIIQNLQKIAKSCKNNSIIKRGRGRPRKIIEEIVEEVKRGRGRPRKTDISIKINNVNINNNINLGVKSFENNKNKNFINYTFALEIAENLLNKNIGDEYISENMFVGVLDGSENNTSNALENVDIPRDSILLVEHNDIISQGHIEKGYPTHNGTLEEFASDFYDKTYNKIGASYRTYDCAGWYFDFCGTIRLNKKGVFQTILKTNFMDGAILAFTFSKRDRLAKKEYDKTKDDFVSKLEYVLCKKGFELEMIKSYDYSGDKLFKNTIGSKMNSFICKIHKIRTCWI